MQRCQEKKGLGRICGEIHPKIKIGKSTI